MSRLASVLVLSLLSFCCTAHSGCVDTVRLWDDGIRGGEKVVMYVFRPQRPNGVSVVVCPGGSYHWLDKAGEGLSVGEWLSSNGITAFVLLYRTAGCAEIAWHTRLIFRGRRHPDMICDAQKALQYVRDNACHYSLDSDKVGMMGFSAGGHLVMSAACFHSTYFPKEQYGIETQTDLRPAFVAAVYPVVTMEPPFVHRRSRRGLLGDSRVGSALMRDSLSIEKHIPVDCPPVFLINCKDDPVVDYHNSLLLDSALTAKGIEHKYILYERGRHGFGVSDYYGSPECRLWRDEFLRWIEATLGYSL